MSEKRPAGRPIGTGKYKDGKIEVDTTYLESHPEKLLEYMKAGYLDCEVYAAFGITKETFYDWKRSHEAFEYAHNVGLEYCQAFYAKHAREAMIRGDDRGAKYFIMIMNNKFGWAKGTYGDQTNVTTNVTVQNMTVLQQKDRDGLIDYIQRIGQKNNDILNVEFTTDTITESSQSIRAIETGTSETSGGFTDSGDETEIQ